MVFGGFPWTRRVQALRPHDRTARNRQTSPAFPHHRLVSIAKRCSVPTRSSFRVMSTIPATASALSSVPVLKPLIPVEGLHVIHLFYKVDHGAWRALGSSQQEGAKSNLRGLVQRIRS